jgi:hypothetical protein
MRLPACTAVPVCILPITIIAILFCLWCYLSFRLALNSYALCVAHCTTLPKLPRFLGCQRALTLLLPEGNGLSCLCYPLSHLRYGRRLPLAVPLQRLTCWPSFPTLEYLGIGYAIISRVACSFYLPSTTL